VPSEYQPDLKAMEAMSDGELWEIARSRMPDAQQDRLEHLLQKNQAESLSEAEQSKLHEQQVIWDKHAKLFNSAQVFNSADGYNKSTVQFANEILQNNVSEKRSFLVQDFSALWYLLRFDYELVNYLGQRIGTQDTQFIAMYAFEISDLYRCTFDAQLCEEGGLLMLGQCMLDDQLCDMSYHQLMMSRYSVNQMADLENVVYELRRYFMKNEDR
ncbi:MAG: hypothetical protein L3J52_09345, partial [Proteobacteria bacterium]|nr:hypothetical protein [Pseudomonadota bacterium]